MPKFVPGFAYVSDDFLRGYLSCAEWLASDSANPDTGEIDGETRARLRGWTRKSIANARRDCKAFVKQAGPWLAMYEESTGRDLESAGHDFWLTRNRHGAGFLDRGDHHCLKVLTDLAHCFGDCHAEAYRNQLHLS